MCIKHCVQIERSLTFCHPFNNFFSRLSHQVIPCFHAQLLSPLSSLLSPQILLFDKTVYRPEKSLQIYSLYFIDDG